MGKSGTVIWDNRLLNELCRVCRELGLREYWPEYMKRVIRELAEVVGVELPRRK